MGQLDLIVKFKFGIFKLPSVIVKTLNNFTPLLRRIWWEILFPQWKNQFNVNKLTCNKHENKILNNDLIFRLKDQYPTSFDTNIKDSIKHIKVKFKLKKNAVPIFHKPYSLPFSLRREVEKEIVSGNFWYTRASKISRVG